ncbi:M15 family metallopeptidase [Ruegeria sp. WL0004]|uniref:M15 family metallopeptidase n=1 Tax=Ruegeria marisflavi TaxID=2984152 RepID=A0ABT2WWW8_9RHOB|nr:M15 family metallopeptidase [Ruegeria sp. WL0004]MCU9840395.1 M15 family metallopeptidase [Ruegeria sp. WL0004]
MRQGTLIGPIIIAIGLVVAAIAFTVVGALLQTADGTTEMRLNGTDQDISDLRNDLARLRDTQRDLEAEVKRLSEDIGLLSGLAARGQPVQVDAVQMTSLEETGDHQETEEMTEEMILAKSRFNAGITQPKNRVMLDILGHPRDSYSTACQPVSNPRLKSLLETRQIGPIRVTMVRPALDSLERIMAQLQASEPDIYAAMGTAGALCARLIRGSATSVSNHSWGTAIDLKLEGQLDGFGDGGTQFGLLLLAELFNEEGWFWGATWNREDSMHFEIGEETLRRWQAEGKL